jgi:hypothetical protein
MAYCWRKENDKKKKRKMVVGTSTGIPSAMSLTVIFNFWGKKEEVHTFSTGSWSRTHYTTNNLFRFLPSAISLRSRGIFHRCRPHRTGGFPRATGEGKGREGKGRTDGRDSRRKVLFTQLVGPGRENLLFTQNDRIFPFSKTDDWTFSTEWLIKMHRVTATLDIRTRVVSTRGQSRGTSCQMITGSHQKKE